MVDRQRWPEYLAAAVAGVVVFVLIVGWVASIGDRITARDCEAMGMMMLKGKPYRCEPMEASRG